MKKLYYLDNSEKERIIKIHEERTKNQYLINEQENIQIKLWNNRVERLNKLKDKCSAMNRKTIFDNPTYKKLSNSIFKQEWSEIQKGLSEIKNLEEYCNIDYSLRQIQPDSILKKPTTSELLGTFLWNRIYSSNSWQTYFDSPLAKILDEAGIESINTKEKTPQLNQQQYDSIIQGAQNIGSKITKGVQNFLNPQQQQQQKKASNVATGGGYTQIGSGYVFNNVFTPDVVKSLRAFINSQDTSPTLTQYDINKLYNKISAK